MTTATRDGESLLKNVVGESVEHRVDGAVGVAQQSACVEEGHHPRLERTGLWVDSERQIDLRYAAEYDRPYVSLGNIP